MTIEIMSVGLTALILLRARAVALRFATLRKARGRHRAARIALASVPNGEGTA